MKSATYLTPGILQRTRSRVLLLLLHRKAKNWTVLAQMDCCFDGFAVPGGGNSMFVSLLRCLRQNSKEISIPGNEKEIREILVDYLLNNNSKYNIQLDRKSRKRLKLTRLTNQLPSIDVLLAANRIFRVRIFVYFWTQ